jgi:hypothetical protein
MRFCLLYSVFCLLLAPAQQALSVDRLVAVVGSDPIFASDVREVERLRLFDPADPLAGVRPESTGLLERLIDRRVVLAEISRYSPAPPDAAAIDAAHTAWAGRFASDQERSAAFRGSRDGPAVVRAFLADTLRIEAYVSQRFSAPDRVARDEAVRAWLRGLRDRVPIRVLK